jgi:hypothetical protein
LRTGGNDGYRRDVPPMLNGLGFVGPMFYAFFYTYLYNKTGSVALCMLLHRTTAPFRHIWMALGAAALVAITLGIFFLEWGPIARLGEGGIERWNVYPLVLWLVAFGSYLLAAPTAPAINARCHVRLIGAPPTWAPRRSCWLSPAAAATAGLLNRR